MSDTYTPRAQQVLVLAQKAADRLNHNFVGAEHLILGILRLGSGTGEAILERMEINREHLMGVIEKRIGFCRGPKLVGMIPLTPRAKKILKLAGQEAKRLNHSYIGTEHLMLGLLREGESISCCVLGELGVDLKKFEDELLEFIEPARLLDGVEAVNEALACPYTMTGELGDVTLKLKEFNSIRVVVGTRLLLVDPRTAACLLVLSQLDKCITSLSLAELLAVVNNAAK